MAKPYNMLKGLYRRMGLQVQHDSKSPDRWEAPVEIQLEIAKSV